MGGGKTYLSMALLILLAKIYPGSRWAVIRRTLPNIKKTVLPTFKKVCPPAFLNGGVRSENTSPLAIFKNGSQIEFYAENIQSDKDLDWMKGLEVNGILLEQLEELSHKCFELSFIRAGRWRIDPMPKPIILATINPTIAWAKQKIYEPFQNGTLNEEWFYLPAKISDNPILFHDKNYMKGFENLDALTRKRYIDGDWDAFGVDMPFAYAFKEEKHVKETSFNPKLPLTLSFDFGVDPMPCVAMQVNQFPREVSVLKEFHIFDGDIYRLLTQIKAWIASLPFRPMLKITGDPSGRARSPLAEGAGNAYKAIIADLGIRSDMVAVPRKFSIQNSRVLVNSVLEHLPVSVHPDCEMLIKDLKYVECEKDAEGKIRLKKTGKNQGAATGNEMLTHLLDAFRYDMHLEFYDFASKFAKDADSFVA